MTNPTSPPRVRRVLAALDFSPLSAAVVERTARLPLAADASITLLHVLPEEIGPTLVTNATAEDAQRDLAASVAELSQRVAPGVQVSGATVTGTPFVEIIRRARDERAELVVLGRHGHRTFADALIGSTAERVFRQGDAPTLIVGGMPSGPYRRPMVAVDLSDTSRRALELALRVIDAQADPLAVVHSWSVAGGGDPAERAGSALGDFLAQFGAAAGRWRVTVRPGDARAVILGEAARQGTDLLVLGTRGHSRLVHLLVGSVAEAVVRGATVDVLVARAAEREFQLV
jgi:nucleotide-binding universal stress UspA family protein